MANKASPPPPLPNGLDVLDHTHFTILTTMLAESKSTSVLDASERQDLAALSSSPLLSPAHTADLFADAVSNMIKITERRF